jgi:asparagine synthase (glutamine-hydrolysing)
VAPLEAATPAELAEELRRQVFAAVARTMRGSERVVVALSGGLDSSGVLAAALATARGAGVAEVRAVTLSFAGIGDDRPHVRALCAELGITPVQVAPHECVRHLRRALVLDGAPCVIPPAAWVLELGERARALGAGCVLTGEGGDLVLDGDLSSLAARAKGGDIWGAARAAARLELIAPSTPARRVVSLVGRPLLRARIPRPLRTGWRVLSARRRYPWLAPALRPWVRAATARQLAREARLVSADGPRTDASWMEHEGADRFLDVGDARAQFESATGVPQHTPFLDPIFVDFMRRIPTSLLFHGDRSRGLYREALRGLVPDSVRLRRTKATFAGSVREMLDVGRGADALADLLDLRELRALGLIEPSAFGAHLRDAVAHNVGQWLELWTPLAIEAFLRQREAP